MMWRLTYEENEVLAILFRHWEYVPFPESQQRMAEIGVDSMVAFLATRGDAFARFYAIVDDMDRLKDAVVSWTLFLDETFHGALPTRYCRPDKDGWVEMGLLLPKHTAGTVASADDDDKEPESN